MYVLCWTFPASCQAFKTGHCGWDNKHSTRLLSTDIAQVLLLILLIYPPGSRHLDASRLTHDARPRVPCAFLLVAPRSRRLEPPSPLLVCLSSPTTFLDMVSSYQQLQPETARLPQMLVLQSTGLGILSPPPGRGKPAPGGDLAVRQDDPFSSLLHTLSTLTRPRHGRNPWYLGVTSLVSDPQSTCKDGVNVRY